MHMQVYIVKSAMQLNTWYNWVDSAVTECILYMFIRNVGFNYVVLQLLLELVHC